MRSQWRVLAAHPDFRRLFAGSSISLLGSSVTTVALPLTAVLLLDARPLEMGLLGAAAFLPHLVLGLPAGVWVERWPFRRILVGADLIAAAALASVPILAASGALTMWVLYFVVLITGTCGLFTALATQSFTPALVPRRDLLAANSSLVLSNSVVSTTGNALGGLLVQVLTAPIAIAVDACSFAISALAKSRISIADTTHVVDQREPMLRSIGHGMRIVLAEPTLRATTIAATVGAFGGQMQTVIFILYVVRDLHLSPGMVGAVVAVSGVAGIVGAAAGVPITTRVGNGPAFIAGMLASSAAGLVMAVAGGPAVVVVAVIVIAQALRGLGPTLYGINQQTIRQVLVPPDVLPRAQATWRFLVHGVQPLGALLGGVLAGYAGMRPALVVGSIVMLCGTAAAMASPLRRMRTLPS